MLLLDITTSLVFFFFELVYPSDKCFCGVISSETEIGVCIRANRQGPDDDRVSIDCYGDVSRVSIKGHSFDSSFEGYNRNDDNESGDFNDGYTGLDDALFTIYKEVADDDIF
jgi:hypothetical protein